MRVAYKVCAYDYDSQRLVSKEYGLMFTFEGYGIADSKIFCILKFLDDDTIEIIFRVDDTLYRLRYRLKYTLTLGTKLYDLVNIKTTKSVSK